MSWYLEYPGVTLSRLLILADIVRRVRNEAVDDHRPERFETNWSLGARQYERTAGALTGASMEYPWLTVVAGASGGAVQYVFAIGGHCVRFCRGDEIEVARRYQSPCFPEIEQRMLFGDEPNANRWLRLVIDNTPEGRPDSLWLMEIDGDTGETTRAFLIPEVVGPAVVTEFVAPPEPPVVIPPVSAEIADGIAADVGPATGQQ
jgi:hypothetical protein